MEELLVATDSRLRSFGSWDCNPKIFTFERTDCAMCFAGDTTFAYPMMIQIKNTVDSNPKIKSRFQRIGVFKGIIVKIMNDMLKFKSDYELPEIEFLFVGYDWQSNQFKIWKILYDKNFQKFTSIAMRSWKGTGGNKKAIFIGDYVKDAKARLIQKLREAGKLDSGDFNYEPFQVLCDMLNEGKDSDKYKDIGGAPQLIKIYKHLNRVSIAIDWEEKGEKFVTLLGRPLVLENPLNPIMDPTSLILRNTNKYN
ncbi:hypothetical protein [Flavobacterium mekongense]|uniref:hypothetical protein n=1 Tax=Flavobacterium mekongense TaxID=3379707 RepID=UPI00399C1602